MQDDGNLVIYTDGRARWSSIFGTWITHDRPVPSLSPGEMVASVSTRHTLRMQGDGNLVLYREYQPLWSSNTRGNPGARFVMQGDGNAVVYSPDGRPLWHSGTWGNPDLKSYLSDEGVWRLNLDHRVLWATRR